jgi:hypothetical protein
MANPEATPIHWRNGGIAVTLDFLAGLGGPWSLVLAPSQPTNGASGAPRETTLELGGVQASILESGGLTTYFYNTSVEGVIAGLICSDLDFQVQAPNMSNVPGPATVTVTDATGSCGVAVYGFFNSTWTAPGSDRCPGVLGEGATVGVGDAVVLRSTSDLSEHGFAFVLVGGGSFSGDLDVPIR